MALEELLDDECTVLDHRAHDIGAAREAVYVFHTEVAYEYPAPIRSLHHQFVVAVTLTNLVFWAVLGSSIGVLRPRVAAWLDAPNGRLA